MLKYPKELVIRINEVYHDVEARYYDERHPLIFLDEAERWEKICNR